MSDTEKNLKEAFAGESQANRKYLAFAKKADQEGLKKVARLFRAAAEAETVHAHNHLKEMGEIKGTKENLQSAMAGEIAEFQSMYPRMIEEAKKDGNSGALRSFTYANEVEKAHAALYQKAIETIDKGGDAEYWVCPVCGMTWEGEPPDACPICATKRPAFKKID
jgi:rubrerythrin